MSSMDLGELGDLKSGPGWAQFKGIGQDPEFPLSDYWVAVLKAAAHTLTPDRDGEGWFDVKTTVYVKHSSPGWVDGFRVQTSAGGGS